MIAFSSRVFRRIRGGCDERFGHKTKLDVVLRVIRISESFGHKTKLDEEIPASATLTNSTTPFFWSSPSASCHLRFCAGRYCRSRGGCRAKSLHSSIDHE
jgi:hypothetical protein